MIAVRAARAFTGREKIIKAEAATTACGAGAGLPATGRLARMPDGDAGRVRELVRLTDYTMSRA